MARLYLTDEMRSMIASALVASEAGEVSLCCGPNAVPLCANIVGWEHARELNEFAHESLGCDWLERGTLTQEQTAPVRDLLDNFASMVEQRYLDNVAELEFLGE